MTVTDGAEEPCVGVACTNDWQRSLGRARSQEAWAKMGWGGVWPERSQSEAWGGVGSRRAARACPGGGAGAWGRGRLAEVATAARRLSALCLPRMRAPGAGWVSVASLVLLWLLGLPWTWSAAAALGVYVGGGGWRFLRIVCKTARRDLL